MIPTVNVIVGYNRDKMMQYFKEGASYTAVHEELIKDPDVLLFDTQGNPNFISFEHNYLKEFNFKLTFIDPRQQFETRFFSGGIMQQIAGTAYNGPIKSLSDSRAKEVNDETRRSLNKIGKEFYQNVKNELVKEYENRTIYIAYGCGNDFKMWSGPHQTVINSVDIVPTQGAKKITLTLAPTLDKFDVGNRRGAYNERVNLNLAGLTMRCVGSSREIKFKDFPNNVYDYKQYLQESSKKTEGIDKYKKEQLDLIAETNPSLVSIFNQVDIHTIIVDAIRNFVQNATNNKNVIVLLPDLNVVCKGHIEKVFDSFRYKTDASLAAAASTGGGPGKFQSNIMKTEIPPDAAFYGSLVGTLEDFGFNVQRIDKSKPSQQAIPNAAVSLSVGNLETPGANAEQRRENYYNDSEFKAVLTEAATSGVPNYSGRLQTVINRLSEASKGVYPIKFVTVTETDLNVLKFWSAKNGEIIPSLYPTLAGYEIFNEEKECIIVGDASLIKDYLYGAYDAEEKEKSISNIKNKVQRSKTELSNLELYSNNTKQSSTEILSTKKNIDDLLTAQLVTIPIHPLDKILLLNKTYTKKIKKIVNEKRNTDGVFGDQSYIPDTFGYEDVDIDQLHKQKLKKAGLPVFKFNVKNPNVIDLNAKVGSSYMSFLKIGFAKVISAKASAVVAGLLPEGVGNFPITTIEEAILFVKKKQAAMGIDGNNSSSREEILKELKNNLDSSQKDPDKFLQVVLAILDSLGDVDFKPYIEVDQNYPGDPTKIMTEMLYDLYRKSTDITIKTLPTFNISRASDVINNFCILFAQDSPIMQENTLPRSGLNSFFSGEFEIVGFRHVIDSVSGAYSEFNLVRNLYGSNKFVSDIQESDE